MRATPRKFTISSVEQSIEFGTGLTQAMLKNIGSVNIIIDFDEPTSADSWVLEPGDTMIIDFSFLRLWAVTNSSTSTLHIIKVFQ